MRDKRTMVEGEIRIHEGCQGVSMAKLHKEVIICNKCKGTMDNTIIAKSWVSQCKESGQCLTWYVMTF